MIHNSSHKALWPALGAVILGVALAGCAQNNAGDARTATTETATNPSGANAGGATAEMGGANGGQSGTSSEAPAELVALFPGATLTKRQFPMDAAAAAHMSKEGGVKFTGDEKEWEVYEASQDGQRRGYAMMTHIDGSGGDTHVVFAVDKNFKITKADAVDAPKMKPLVAQAVGKNHDAKWKVGQDFKPVAGVSNADAQAAVNALRKGVLILEENFNPSHGDHQHGSSPASGEGAASHKDDGHAH